MKKKLFLYLLLLSVSFSQYSIAQRFRIDVATGLSAYAGDLQNSLPRAKNIHWGNSIGLTYDISDRWKARFNFTKLKVGASDDQSTRYDLIRRNLSFSTNVTEFALGAEYSFFSEEDERRIMPYAFAGFGVFTFNPQTIYNGQVINLRNVGTEGQFIPGNFKGKGENYSLTQLNMFVGVGAKYVFNEMVSLGVEFNARALFTDYLDDIHASSHIDPSVFTAAGPQYDLVRALNYRAYELNPVPRLNYNLPRGLNSNDAYYSFQLKASFRLDFFGIGGGGYY